MPRRPLWGPSRNWLGRSCNRAAGSTAPDPLLVRSFTARPARERIQFGKGAGMRENQNDPEKNDTQAGDIARREFVALSMATGLGVVAGAAEAAGLEIVETDVESKTPDGTCDAAF